jgi:PAS domain S-box-containing protein
MLTEPGATAIASLLPTQGQILLAAVQALSAELDTVRQQVDPEVSAQLAGAEEELAAIHDEMRRQQGEIETLLAGADSNRAALIRRFLSALPLATVLTSSAGKILEANPAAHELLGVPIAGLAGKPIFAFLAQADRSRLRTALSQTAHQPAEEPQQLSAMITPRSGPAVSSRLALVRELESPVPDGVALEGPAPGSTTDPDGPDGVGADDEVHAPTSVFWVILPDLDVVGQAPSHQQLEALTRLCRLGADGSDLRTTLGQVVRLCLQAVAEASDISLLVGSPLEPSLAITSSVTAQHLDGLQHTRAAGPAFDAHRTRRPIALDDTAVAGHSGLADDEQAATVRSLLAIPLLADQAPTGVMTLYATGSPKVATLEVLRQVMPFVEAAQSLIRDTHAYEELLRTQQQLESALTSRAVIDQAKGMIMMALKCSADTAFGHLVRMSSTRHEKVREVAQDLVDDVVMRKVELPWSPSK